MENGIRLKRTASNIQFQIDLLNELKMPFEVQNGTYTTTIITPKGRTRYMMNTYSNRVFKVAAMIKSDVLKSPVAKEIIESKYFKTNFGFSQNAVSYKAKHVLNIDITSAYATCLLNNDLISDRTYNALKKLPKTERLPCVGMLATSHTKYVYDGGECIDVKAFRSPTAPVFFFLIDQINYVMRNIEFLLGDKYIFHWVDGIFFNYDTDPKIIKMIEDYLESVGYEYKYEDVKDFSVKIDDKKVNIQMIKNGISKQYTIGKDSVGKEVGDYLSGNVKSRKTTIK